MGDERLFVQDGEVADPYMQGVGEGVAEIVYKHKDNFVVARLGDVAAEAEFGCPFVAVQRPVVALYADGPGGLDICDEGERVAWADGVGLALPGYGIFFQQELCRNGYGRIARFVIESVVAVGTGEEGEGKEGCKYQETLHGDLPSESMM